MDKMIPKIFNIQRFCSHDGPGIRTVVFFKGCPLKCQWCSNPESQSLGHNILFDARKCIACKRCVEICPQSIPIGKQGIDPRCTLCGLCTTVCPTKALEFVGREYHIDKVMQELVKDERYYQTGGGVTISGGEPLMHPDYVCDLANAVREQGYHLALETTGFARWEVVDKVFSLMDIILYDVKHMDEGKHKLYIGTSNKLILGNLEKAAQKGYPILVRVPLVGGINDDEENITRLAEFCAKNGLLDVEFLPYHKFGESKYTALRIEYLCEGTTPTLQHRQQLAKILQDKGIAVKIGK